MKKVLLFVVLIGLVLSMSACSGGDDAAQREKELQERFKKTSQDAKNAKDRIKSFTQDANALSGILNGK